MKANNSRRRRSNSPEESPPPRYPQATVLPGDRLERLVYGWGSDAGLPPERDKAPGVTPTAIAVGGGNGVAIGSDEQLYSWGYTSGDGTSETRFTPGPITLAPGVTPDEIAAGGGWGMAIGSDGRLYQWGSTPNTGLELSPQSLAFPSGVNPTAISASSFSGSGLALVSGGPAAGGTIELKKATGLIGRYAKKVSGAGWSAHGDTSVMFYECATTYYTASSCADLSRAKNHWN
jgi:hypothetical protein